jgi:hypothetical protein
LRPLRNEAEVSVKALMKWAIVAVVMTLGVVLYITVRNAAKVERIH